MNYQKIHDAIIERAKLEKRKKSKDVYYERHHIIPRCLDGTDDKTNLVLLTAREHFVIHKLLCKIYPDNVKLQYALWAMCNQNKFGIRHKVSSIEYNRIKSETSKIRAIETSGRVSWNKGKKCPNISKSKLGKPRPDVSNRNKLQKGILRGFRPDDWINPSKGKKQPKWLINKRAESKKRNGKMVLQYQKDGTFIQEHDSVTDAANWLREYVGKGDIISNLKHKTKTAGGYIWKYKEN